MSAIGKLFVVLNLLFSLVILGVLGGILAKSEEYKTKFEGEVKAREADNTQHAQLASELNAQIKGHMADKGQLTNQLDAAKVENESLTRENASLKQSNDELRNSVSGIQSDYAKFTASLTEALAHNKDLEGQNGQLIEAKNAAVDAQRAAEEEAARAKSDIARLNDSVKQLSAQIDELEKTRGDLNAQLQAAAQMGFDLSKVRAQPQIDGLVQKVNQDLGLVVLSVGADDGVTRGTKFEIYSGGVYKGQVVVDDVYPDNSAARITRQGSAAIAASDKATTRL